MSQEIPVPPAKNIGGGSHNQFRREQAGSIPDGPGGLKEPSGEGMAKGADIYGRPKAGPAGRNPAPAESSFR